MKYDFSGWATKNDLRCADGRTIRRNAFLDNDGQKVPLVWSHQHDEPTNVLGHAILENRDDGVYAYCTFNNTEMAKSAKELVRHGDINALSIYANKLKQNGGDVVHGVIKEVSLVIAGANPGALIDNLTMEHGEESETDAIIYNDAIYLDFSDEFFEHSDDKKEEDKEMPDTKDKKKDDQTIQDVIDSMNEDQKKVLYYLVSKLIKEKNGEDKKDDEGEKKDMKHNVFESDNREDALMHAELEAAVIGDAKRYGSLKESFLVHADEYGITNIDYLFPDAKAVTEKPGFIKRNPDAWVSVVMNGTHHTPFSRIKMLFADLTEDEARAKGYVKGALKKEEVFSLLKRVVEPTMVYKKQKLDRSDIVDITDFDVVAWLKGEMRLMLDEEIARAILFGDGRSASSPDKISATNIIPICSDAELYTISKEVIQATGETFAHAFIRSAVEGQDAYEGSGNTALYAANTTITQLLLLEDGDGRRMYKDLAELALALNVNKIVKVPASIVPDGIYGIIVDLNDYNVGADKGGSVNLFDDFDIDYNRQKYLIETRCSGALTKPYSAVCLKAATESVG